jgi:cobalt-zinc-cadmium efflux system outer membrane protein
VEFSTGEGDPFEGGPTRDLSEWSLRQTLENPITRHFRLGALDQQVEAAQEDARFGVLEVDYQIRLHFFRILYLQERLRLARLNEEALAEVRGLMEVRARVGEVKELEAIRLRVEHLRSRNQVTSVEIELTQYRQHLNTFLGDALPNDFSLSGELAARSPVPDFQSLVESNLPEHPLLRRAARERDAAQQQFKVSQFGWIPDPVLSATSATEMDGDIFKWGIGIEVPLWNLSRSATARDRETLLQTEHQREALALELQAQLMVHHNQLLLQQQTLDLFGEGLLEEAELSMQIAETSYRAGEISLVEYLDARRTYQSIQIEYQQALFDWNRAMIELDRAAGGGIL